MWFICYICFTGILVHFDSVALKDFYFVDSQWLCDMFAHVVSSEYNSKYLHCITLSLLQLSLPYMEYVYKLHTVNLEFYFQLLLLIMEKLIDKNWRGHLMKSSKSLRSLWSQSSHCS